MKKFFSMLLLLCGFVTLSATMTVNAAEKSATYTIKTTTSVECDDSSLTWAATYSQTYNTAQQATSGQSLTFTVTNFGEDIVIKRLVMSTKTNASKGAGNVKVTIGATDIYNQSYAKPNGSTWVDYEIPNTNSVKGNLSVVISCTTNSLYCQSYTIFYEKEGDTTPSYDTIFNYNYDDAPNNVTVSTNDGEAVKFVSNPKREGYVFAGWYDAAEGGNQVESLVSSSDNNGKILYAHWDVDNFTHAVFNKDNFKTKSGGNSTGYNDFNGTHTIDDVVFTSNQVSNNGGSNLQFQKNAGYMYNTAAISGNIAYIKMDITGGTFEVSTSAEPLTGNGANVETLSASNSTFIPSNSDDKYFYIKVTNDATGAVNSIDIAYTYVEKQTYTVAFDAGTGAFAAGKGEAITGNKGESTSVTLPTASDLASKPYIHMVLTGWSDGTNTHNPGATVDVSADTTFAAVYVVPENLTVAQAIEVATATGTTATTVNFSTTATITSISGKNVLVSDSSTAETFTVYNPSNVADLKVGDVIKATGKIKMYSTTKEYDAPKVVVVKPAYATAFEAEQTMASLKIDGDAVSIRFGNAIAEAAYNSDARYGVVVSTAAADLENLTVAAVDALIVAGKGTDCTPVRVATPGAAEEDANGNYYQFALVLDNVPVEDYNTNVTAVMFMIVGDTVYVAGTKTASVKTVAAAYLAGDTTGFSGSLIETLNNLAA